jgi:hypothetical protein
VSLLVAGLRKLRSRTATLVAAIVAAILVGLELVLVGVSLNLPAEATGSTDPALMRWLVTFPGAYDAILALVFAIGGLIAMIYVAAVAGTEWSWGTLKNAVVRGESRSRYTIATFGSISLMLLAGTLTTLAAGVLGAVAGAGIAGLPPGGLADPGAMPHVLVSVLRCWIALTALSSVAYAVAMVAKSQMAGVGMVIGVYLASILAPLALPEALRTIFNYLPFSIASDAMGLYGPTPSGETTQMAGAVEPNLALVVTLGWLVASLAVAALATERAEISS